MKIVFKSGPCTLHLKTSIINEIMYSNSNTLIRNINLWFDLGLWLTPVWLWSASVLILCYIRVIFEYRFWQPSHSYIYTHKRTHLHTISSVEYGKEIYIYECNIYTMMGCRESKPVTRKAEQFSEVIFRE